MSFIIALCALLVALLAEIALAGIGTARRPKVGRDVSPFDAW